MFRSMRRYKQQLSKEECEGLLAVAPRGVLAVLGDEGYPYAVPLNFVYDNGSIFFHCATEGHKLDAILSCDKASFCVLDEGRQEEGEWWLHFNSVIAFGRVRRVEDENVIHDALQKLGAKYFPQDYDIEADIARNLSRVAILQLSIEHLTGKHVREK